MNIVFIHAQNRIELKSDPIKCHKQLHHTGLIIQLHIVKHTFAQECNVKQERIANRTAHCTCRNF